MNIVSLGLLGSTSAPEDVPSPSVITVTEERVSVADLLRPVDYFSITISSPISLKDIVEKYFGMFDRNSRSLGERFAEKFKQGSWLVRKDGIKSPAAHMADRHFSLAIDMARFARLNVGQYESQRKFLPAGDEVLPSVVIVSMAILHHLRTGEWLPGLVQNSLRCAETYMDLHDGTPQRLCVSLDATRTQLVLAGFSDEASDVHLALAVGRKGSFVQFRT